MDSIKVIENTVRPSDELSLERSLAIQKLVNDAVQTNIRAGVSATLLTQMEDLAGGLSEQGDQRGYGASEGGFVSLKGSSSDAEYITADKFAFAGASWGADVFVTAAAREGSSFGLITIRPYWT